MEDEGGVVEEVPKEDDIVEVKNEFEESCEVFFTLRRTSCTSSLSFPFSLERTLPDPDSAFTLFETFLIFECLPPCS